MPFPNPPASGVVTLTAANTSMTVGGTATAKTVATGTLDVIATQEPPAAAVNFNAQKGTNVANGTLSNDIAAFGQIPTTIYGIAGITSAAGHITVDVTLTHGTTTDIFSTASLAIGKWLVTMQGDIRIGFGNTGGLSVFGQVGTATATIEGISAAAADTGLSGASADQVLGCTFIATVTGAGTLKFSAQNHDGAADGTARAEDFNGTARNVTGYTAIRLT